MKHPLKNIYINPQKVKSYLLNINHPDGGAKAKLLIGFGFTIKYTSVLETAIINHVTNNDVCKVITTPFGEKYLVEGPIETPFGKSLQVRSVWVKELKEEIIKFVTLYPI
jgi:hypothetical protein